MSNQRNAGLSWLFAVDTWAVIVALALALAVRAELIKKVPW